MIRVIVSCWYTQGIMQNFRYYFNMSHLAKLVHLEKDKESFFLKAWLVYCSSSCCKYIQIHLNKCEYIKPSLYKYSSCTLQRKVNTCAVLFSWGKQMSGTRYLTVAINDLSLWNLCLFLLHNFSLPFHSLFDISFSLSSES